MKGLLERAKKEVNNGKSIKKETKIKIFSCIVIGTIIIIAAMLFLLSKNNNLKLIKSITDPELARAMTYGELTEEDEKTQSENVRFSAYFARDLNGDGYAEKVKGTCKEVGKQDILYMSLNVLEDGTLKNGKIEIESDNIYFQTALIQDETIKENYISANTREINLKDVSVGTQKLIFGTVRSGDYSKDSTMMSAIGNNINKYSGTNRIILTGTHVASDGIETKVRKEIEFQVDWYNTPISEIPYTYAGDQKNRNQSYNNVNIINVKDNTLDLSFKLVSQEKSIMTRLSKAYIEGEIPKLNGFDPVEVKITGDNVNFSYDKETRKFSAYRKAILNENGIIIKSANSGVYEENRYNEFYVTVRYPLESYESIGIDTININIPVKAYYEGYNNKNSEFENPVKSNVAEDIIGIVYQNGTGDVIGFDVKVGKYLPKPYDAWVVSKDNVIKEYNKEPIEETDTYEVLWAVARGNDGKISSVKLKETDKNYTDKFLTTDNEYVEMEKFVTNKGIYFYGADNMFGKDGYIRVINDETDEVIHEFTKNDWNLYSKENPFLYQEDGINHIRIETSEALNNSYFTVYNIKEIDSKELVKLHTRDEFDKYTLIYSYLTGYTKIDSEEYVARINDQDRANYDPIQSIVEISNISPEAYSTQETMKNSKIAIKTKTLEYNTSKWLNGQFILKFPKEILDVKINEITINNENVRIAGYSLEESEDGLLVKIITENENPEIYEIYVDADITPDPRILTINKNIELYSYNEECSNYEDNGEDIYDLNGNGEVKDFVGKTTKNIQLVGPTSLITSETASNFNGTKDTVTGPQIAILEKSEDERTTDISINLLNNYSGNISGIRIIGKIPFIGNDFQYTGNDLGSMYDTKLTGSIEIPENLKEYTEIYYSEKEEVNDDINDETNEWKTEDEINDYSNIKTYLIDLGTYIMQKGEKEEYVYTIALPGNLNYNDVSYSTHAISFYLETEGGKLRAQTETNKLGLMIAKKYNLEINKVKAGTDLGLKGAVYQLTDVITGERRILKTDEVGKLTFKDLYIERTYKLKEIKAPSEYEKEESEITFYGTATDDGKIVVEVLDGNVRDKETNNLTEVFTLEDEPNYNIELTKYEEGTNKIIPNVRFELFKEGSEYKRTVSTDNDGKIQLTNLNIDVIYELKEVKANGYYLPKDTIKFKLKRNENNYTLEIIQGNITVENIESNNDTLKIPNVSVRTTNEKAKLYTLEIMKYAKKTDEKLKDASFKITGPGIEEGKIIKTDDTGIATITDLYEYVEDKNTDGIYTIKEVGVPQGYILNDDEIKIKVFRNNENNIELEILSGSLKETRIDQENNKVILSIENEPLFKLIKIDGKTKEALPNTKFAISEVVDEKTETEALDNKGNPVGKKETINGVEYRVVTTNANGEISLALKNGLYKLVEVEALEGYQLSEELENRTYYFGVGKSQEEIRELLINKDVQGIGAGSLSIRKLLPQEDGGYIASGTISSSLYINSEDTVDGKPIHLITDRETYLIYADPVIIKYNKEGKVEWARKLAGTGMDSVKELIKLDKGRYLWYVSTTFGIQSPDATEKGYVAVPKEYTSDKIEKRMHTLHPYISTFLVLNEEGIFEDVYFVEDITVSNYRYEDDGTMTVLASMYGGELTIPGDITSNQEDMTIHGNGNSETLYMKLDKNKKINKVMLIGGDNSDSIYSWTSQNGKNTFIYGYTYSSNITINRDYTVSGENIVLTRKGTNNPVVIKFNENIDDPKVEWAKIIGGNGNIYTDYAMATQDGGIIVVGYYTNTITIPAAETVNYEEIKMIRKGSMDGYIIKYNKDGLVEYAQSIGGTAAETMGKVYIRDTDNKLIIECMSQSASYTIPAQYTENGEDIVVERKQTITGYETVSLIFNSDMKVEGIEYKNNDNNLPANSVYNEYTGETVYYSSQEIVVVKDGKIISRTENKYNEYTYVYFLQPYLEDDGSKIVIGKYSGEMTIPESQTVSNEKIVLENNGSHDALIIKFNKDDKVVWARSLGDTGSDNFQTMDKTKDGNYIIGGVLSGGDITIPKEETVNNEEIVLNQIGSQDFIVIKYNTQGQVVFAVRQGCSLENRLGKILSCDDGGFVTFSYTKGKFKIPAEETVDNMEISVENNGQYDGTTIKYNSEGKVEWATNFGGAINELIYYGTINTDGSYTFVGYCNSKTFTIPGSQTESGEDIIVEKPTGTQCAIIVRTNNKGKVKWVRYLNSSANSAYYTVIPNSDNSNIVSGVTTQTGTITIPSEETVSETGDIVIANPYNDGTYVTFEIKYDENGKVAWATVVGSGYDSSNGRRSGDGTIVGAVESINVSANDSITGEPIVENASDGQYVVLINADGKVENYYHLPNVTGMGYSQEKDGMIYVASQLYRNTGVILEIEDKLLLPEIADKDEIIIENHKKEYNITTDVNGEGGTISGQGSTEDNPYEIVEDGKDSVKDIVIKPDDGYKVLEITINGEKIQFVEKKDGSVVLDRFIYMTSNKHIEVTFSKNVSKIVVHHYKKETQEKLAEDEIYRGEVGDNYSTAPKEIDGFNVVESEIPGNATGKYIEQDQEVIYYYEEESVNLVVHHYLEGTEDIVPGSEQYQRNEEYEKGTEYYTEAIPDLDSKYELIYKPSNATGILENSETIVTYYYRVKDSAGLIVHHVDIATNEKIAEDEVYIGGKYGDEYTTKVSNNIPEGYRFIKKTDNWEGTLIDTSIEVTYYYISGNPNIIKNEVSKTGTASIDERTDKITYNIVYEGVIDTYIGEVAVYLEDTLPYKIDVEESDLDGGTYDEGTNTIKWYENVGEIDTLETGENVPATIRVEKTIEVLYKDIDIYQDSMINEIKGVMYLPADNKTVEDEGEYETEIAVKGEVVVKYVDKNTNEEISSRVEKRGRVGTEYDVTEDKKEIEGYTLVEAPGVKTGTYTEEKQEKVYYYAKNTDVHVTYIDKISKEEIAEEELIEGYEGQKYTTDKKEIEGYTFVEDSGNTEGEMTRERTEVVYYYLYKTKVRVEHRDKYTDGLLGEEEQEGLEGEVYESSPKDFEGYVLVEEPENRTVTMTKDEIVLIYYYSYISGGVIEKHIDEITGEILDEEVYEGKEGDPYSTKEKEFRGYDLVEEKYPANSSGEMTRDVIEVKYYYIKRATVRVEYIDKVNDEKLTEDVIINGHENDKYRTEEKEFEGYDLVEIPENATGEMKITVNEDGTYNAEIVVTYYYKYVSAGVIEKHIDEITGEVLTEERYTGYEGDKYETKEKEFAGYDLVKEKYPENATGVMTREEIEVDYYYIKKATVRVEYVDKYTGNKIIEDVIISGHEKEEYKTEEKEFEGYDYIEVVGETEGTMTLDEEKVITYYYLKPATVITRYLEEETEEVLAPEDIVEGHEGDEYVTGAKEIEYYKISKLPENATGEMKDTIYVTYYYKKKIVDLSLEKTIDSMEIEGKKQRITNEDLVKAEVYRKSINSTDIKIVFNIKVTNEGEIAGKVDILEKIPEYLSMSEKDNPGWTVEGDEARYETETIEAGKSKTYKVVMRWEKGDGHFGMQKNIAKIEKVITPSGFDEENLQNNSDESEVMITISTGVEKMSGIILIALLYILAIVYMSKRLVTSKEYVKKD